MRSSMIVTFAMTIATAAGLASAVAAQTAIDGEWDVTFNNAQGDTINAGTMSITQDGTTVTGTMDTEEGFAELAGSIEGTDLEYVVTVNDDGHILQWAVSGSVEGDEMHGTFDGEETGAGDWVAFRVP